MPKSRQTHISKKIKGSVLIVGFLLFFVIYSCKEKNKPVVLVDPGKDSVIVAPTVPKKYYDIVVDSLKIF